MVRAGQPWETPNKALDQELFLFFGQLFRDISFEHGDSGAVSHDSGDFKTCGKSDEIDNTCGKPCVWNDDVRSVAG